MIKTGEGLVGADGPMREDSQPTISRVERIDESPRLLRLALSLKASLVVVSALVAVVPLEQLEGKGMQWRLPIVVLAACVVPIAWRGRLTPYPATADLLVMSPFALDLVGNLAGWYDSFAHFDDVFHFVNWVLLVGAFLAWRFRRVTDRRDAVMLGTGFGAIAIVVWEIAEWAAGELGAAEALGLTYADTISDLALSTTGGLVGALIAAAVLGQQRSADTNLQTRESIP